MQVDGDVEALSSGDCASQQNQGVGREVWVTRRRVLGVGPNRNNPEGSWAGPPPGALIVARERTAFMKAFVFERTGDPNDVLAARELPIPKPGPGEILVRVRLSPVHPSDMHIIRGRFGRQPTRYQPVPASSASVSSRRLGPALQVPHLARASFF